MGNRLTFKKKNTHLFYFDKNTVAVNMMVGKKQELCGVLVAFTGGYGI